MKRNINEISSSDFRNKIKSLGFSEKGSELTSGGEVKPAVLDIISQLVTEWQKLGGSNCPLKFTSGNDKYHTTLNYNSLHKSGEAVDVTLPSGCHTSFIKLLNDYKKKHNGFSYIDEYRNPSSKATGGHFHMSYRPSQPEGSNNQSTNTNTTHFSQKELDNVETETQNDLLDNMTIQGLGLSQLSKSLTNLQEDVKRIKNLMK